MLKLLHLNSSILRWLIIWCSFTCTVGHFNHWLRCQYVCLRRLMIKCFEWLEHQLAIDFVLVGICMSSNNSLLPNVMNFNLYLETNFEVKAMNGVCRLFQYFSIILARKMQEIDYLWKYVWFLVDVEWNVGSSLMSLPMQWHFNYLYF